MEQINPSILARLQDLDSIWNPLDPAAAESAYRELLPAAQLLTETDRSYLIELMALIARASSAQGRIAEARASLEETSKLLEEQGAAYRVSARIRWLVERGRLYVLEKTPAQAHGLLSEAWTLAINSGEDYFAVDITRTMALIDKPKSQQDWILRAIDIAEKSPMPKTKRWLGTLYASLGWKCHELRQFDKSLEMFQKALSHVKVHGSDREAFVAKWSIGKALRALGRTEEALAVQKALIAELGLGGARDGRLYEEMAECLQSLNRTSEAQLYFELAYRELSSDEWVADNQPLKLKRMKDLGKVKNSDVPTKKP